MHVKVAPSVITERANGTITRINTDRPRNFVNKKLGLVNNNTVIDVLYVKVN
jgi:hypothetical protein